MAPGEDMLAVGERRDAVEREPRGPAPDDDVTALEPHAAGAILASRAAEEKDRWQAERDGDDRCGEVALVAILMQRQPRAGLVAVDQARVGLEARIARRVGGPRGEVAIDRRQGRPRLAAQ